MVPFKKIQACNAQLKNADKLLVAVFVGGTSGIGKYTIRALVATGARSRIHIVGRKSAEERTSSFAQEMSKLNARAEIVYHAGEVSLLTETKRLCENIKKNESQIDLLFMTTGYAPFGARSETSEGLEVTQSLEYYTRILFIQLLAAELDKSESARVVSVLAGGLEPASVPLDDLDLKRPENFGGFKAQGHYAAMNTMTMEKLAGMHRGITFVHSFPGWVFTGNHRRGADAGSMMNRILWPVFDPLIRMMAMGEEESGQRNLFESTSAAFGGRGTPWDGEAALNSVEERGNGLFLVGDKCESKPNVKNTTALRGAAQEKIWGHTQKVLQPYL